MKIIIKIVLIFCFVGCATIKLNESWKNPSLNDFNPKNILVVGVTPDFEARSNFEFQVTKALNDRNINAIQSAVVFEKLFQDATQTEAEMEAQVSKLLSVGYDTVLVSTVKGVEENELRSGASPKLDHNLQKFLGAFFTSQEEYFDQDHYKSYKVFCVETHIYKLKKGSEKLLVWSGNYDIINPKDISKTIHLYVKALIKSLEKEELIAKKA